MKRHVVYIGILLTVSLLCSCNKFDKLLKSNDFDAKYNAAMVYYQKGDYNRAKQLFENLTMYYRGRDNAENVAWYYAMSLVQEKDFYTAGYQFRNFVKQFPYSERAEDALFQSAYCKYKESPAYSLDQTQTREAIADFELYLEKYPSSKHVPEINGYLDEMRAKLMQKEYEIAFGYYKIESYHAAYISFNNFLNLYPESKNKEDAMYYIIKSGYELAINSQESKVEERLLQVVADFERFSALFTTKKYISSVQDIYTRTKAMLAKMNK